MISRLKYLLSPISSLKALSGVLQIPERLLIEVLDDTSKYYRENKPIIKPDGSERVTYSLKKELKIIQKRINKNIFQNVVYPIYLQGSIKDKQFPRTYHSDARIHAGANIIISEDVSNYFHSIDRKHVLKMWKHLFCFPPDISEILTKLTTHNGYVPQGGVTSSYIANLILWDLEPNVVAKLKNIDLNYTRYIDDITLSSTVKNLPDKNIEIAIGLVYSMLLKKGVSPNRKKHQIMRKSNRMNIHKLTVNSGRPTLSKIKRNNIRMDMYNLLKIRIAHGRNSQPYKSKFNSVSGRVRELSIFHAHQALKLRATLDRITPK